MHLYTCSIQETVSVCLTLILTLGMETSGGTYAGMRCCRILFKGMTVGTGVLIFAQQCQHRGFVCLWSSLFCILSCIDRWVIPNRSVNGILEMTWHFGFAWSSCNVLTVNAIVILGRNSMPCHLGSESEAEIHLTRWFACLYNYRLQFGLKSDSEFCFFLVVGSTLDVRQQT